MMTAWIAGGTGLVGGILLRRLLQDAFFTRVVTVGRRSVALHAPKLVQAVVDFSSPDSFEQLEAPDVAFSCLGTTMKSAGSREAFRAVDFDAVLNFARSAHAKGARAFLHVTAVGADPRSRVFYNSVKGAVEQAVAAVGFPSVYAVRPSILDGDRQESRPAERVGLSVMRTLGPLLGKYRPTPVEAVAEAMVTLAKAPVHGAHVVDAGTILKMRPT